MIEIERDAPGPVAPAIATAHRLHLSKRSLPPRVPLCRIRNRSPTFPFLESCAVCVSGTRGTRRTCAARPSTSGSLKPTKVKALLDAGISKTQDAEAEEFAGGKTQQERARPSALAIAIDARQTSSQPQNLGDGECALVIGPLGGGKNHSLVVRVLDLDRVTAAPDTTV